jgi:hypothetical protein
MSIKPKKNFLHSLQITKMMTVELESQIFPISALYLGKYPIPQLRPLHPVSMSVRWEGGEKGGGLQ